VKNITVTIDDET